MDRVGDRLAQRLHGVFDTAPATTLALRVRRDGGLQWSISGSTLTVCGQAFDLQTHTLAQLKAALEAEGFDVPYINSELAGLLGMVLLEGSGDQDTSNGDHLYAYGSHLLAILHAIGSEFGDAYTAIQRSLAQLILPSSTAEWADLFGRIFGIPRLRGEADADFTQRILTEVRRERSNPVSIAKNIRSQTGATVSVREPWKEIFALSTDALSGQQHLQGAPVYEYHRFQLESTTGVDWRRIDPVADADRPAGTLRLPSAVRPLPLYAERTPTAVVASGISIYSQWLRFYAVGVLSDDLSLSAYTLDPLLRIGQVSVNGLATFGLRGPYTEDNPWLGLWDHRVWRFNDDPVEIYPPNDLLLINDPLLLHTSDGQIVRTSDGRYVFLVS